MAFPKFNSSRKMEFLISTVNKKINGITKKARSLI